LALLVPTSGAFAQWVTFQDQTSSRLVSTVGGPNDTQEKRYAWGDIDHDGDIDLIVVRKQPFTSPGKQPEVLYINENGVLTDRTQEFASAADVGGDQGFLTLTNTRDAELVDVDNDGWLDLVTAPTISPTDPKHIGHPRIYLNRGCTGACNGTADWLGFRFENSRIPTMLSDSGQSGFNPCFCHVTAGDVTGDGYADLWFVDYDSGTNCGGPGDYNDKLLVNRGAAQPGFFDDVTETAFSTPFQDSAFGASSGVLDVNGDAIKDLLKQFAGSVELAFNNPLDQGQFSSFSNPYGGSAYFVSPGDLNNDNKPDLVISDDGGDRYLLNQGNGTDTKSDFISFTYSFQHTGAGGPASDDGFGGDNLVADLNNDGWNDVLITDVDVDSPGCDRRTHIYKNLGGVPGGNVVLQEQTTGSNCQSFMSNPSSCIVASIPADKLEGVHDIAVFDINGDSYKDMVVGRCTGTQVYMNVPPVPPAGATPDGDEISGQQLMLQRGLGPDTVTLSWGPSCSLDDDDYSIYEGAIGDFSSHGPKACTTGGATTHSYVPSEGDRYFLVVPHNSIFDGSFGTRSDGQPRHALSFCRPVSFDECE
jgi:hypothetical protein